MTRKRFNQLYRQDPLTWDEISLHARCGDEPIMWRVKDDGDAAKEIWLLFENIDSRSPLFPGRHHVGARSRADRA